MSNDPESLIYLSLMFLDDDDGKINISDCLLAGITISVVMAKFGYRKDSFIISAITKIY